MIVYHGTDSYSAHNILEHGIDLMYGDDSVDNGKGFYTTPSQAFALRRAKMMTALSKKLHKDTDQKPVVLRIDIDESAFENLNIKKFDGCDYPWKEFVLYNRVGKRFLRNQGIFSDNHNLDLKFDIVIDETADAGVGTLVSKLRYKETRRDVDLKSMINQIRKSDDDSWGKQVSFHSQRALQMCIRSIHIDEVE